jgi:hypothetical protein
MEGFCSVLFMSFLNRRNAGKDDDEFIAEVSLETSERQRFEFYGVCAN